MSVLTCPYRGAAVPKLSDVFVCQHPDVRGPCTLDRAAGAALSCLECKRWRDSPECAAEKLAGLPTLDPKQWEPPPPPPKPIVTAVPAILPCIHRGADTGRLVDCATGCKSLLKVFTCAALGECTLGKAGAGVPGCCQGCAHRVVPGDRVQAGDGFVYFSTRRLIDDTLKLLLPQIPATISAVAGVPRSGLLPASILATHLQLPLLSIRKGELLDVGAGSRGKGGWAGNRRGQLFVVDDSVYGGGNMCRLRRLFGERAIYSAIYTRPEVASLLDCYARAVPSPHLFEWNMLNGAPLIGHTLNPRLHGGMALDMDGIICHDEHSGGPPGTPYMMPLRHPIPMILTARSEEHRASTEAWLARHCVKWGRLQMKPRKWKGTDGEYKALHYGASPHSLMVESCPDQAETIWRLSGKPVLCPILERVFQ